MAAREREYLRGVFGLDAGAGAVAPGGATVVTGVLEASGAAREWLLLVGGATLAALVAW